jgi:hypothetical protein
MSIQVSLCLLKIEIVDDMESEGGKSISALIKLKIAIFLCLLFSHTENQASASSVVKEVHGQRKPKNIQIESYANVVLGEEAKGVLPKSREVTPVTETTTSRTSESSVLDAPTSEVKFFSGNPFVEQTTGILHLYKKK